MKNILLLSFLLISSTSLANNKLIIGSDDRYPITEMNKNKAHESIGLLLILSESGRLFTCTGTIIGTHHVLTAAHCLVDENGREFSAVYFMPKVNQDLQKNPTSPFGIITARSFKVLDEHLPSPSHTNDLGLVVFDEALPYSPLPISQALKDDKELTIAGYPGDKTYGTLWEAKGTISSIIGGAHKVDTMAGQSGAAVRNSAGKIIGVHSGGISLLVFKRNLFLSFTKEHIDFLKREIE